MSNEVDQTPAPWPAPVEPGQPGQPAQSFDYSWGQTGPGPVPPPAGWPAVPSVPPGGATTNGLAIASLVLGLLGWLLFGVGGIIAIVLGLVARGQIKKSNGAQKGGGLAVAGITLGALSLALSALLVAAVMTLGTIDIPRDQFVQRVVTASEADPNFAPLVAEHPTEMRSALQDMAGCYYDIVSVEPLYLKAVYDDPMAEQVRVPGVSRSRLDELDAQATQRCLPPLQAAVASLVGG